MLAALIRAVHGVAGISWASDGCGVSITLGRVTCAQLGMRCRVREIETKYYADGENAYCMVKRFKSTEENGRKVNIVV